MLNETSTPIGIYEWTKPVIAELPLEAGMWLVICTDGVLEAGHYFGRSLDVAAALVDLAGRSGASSSSMAEDILGQAVQLDQGRPQDDMSVLVLHLAPRVAGDGVRRLAVRFPLPYL
jgi:serine phosphatase RsbU (regulator of sigma subunit)